MEGVALVILARVCLPGILRSLNRRLMARIEVIAYQDDAAPHVEQLALATSTPSYCTVDRSNRCNGHKAWLFVAGTRQLAVLLEGGRLAPAATPSV